MVHAAPQAKIPQGGIAPPAPQAKVHDPANTVDQLKKLRESAVADSASPSPTPTPPLPATQHPPPFSAPAPESLQGGMAKPVGPD
eukprot:8357546-Pyramimonas_sp.AAC.1